MFSDHAQFSEEEEEESVMCVEIKFIQCVSELMELEALHYNQPLLITDWFVSTEISIIYLMETPQSMLVAVLCSQ